MTFWAVVGVILKIGIIVDLTQGTVAYLILVERKVAAFAQDRLGPNRVGPFGLLQPLADGAKMLLKEDVIPGYVSKPLFVLAPMIAIAAATIGFAVIPFGPTGRTGIAGLSRDFWHPRVTGNVQVQIAPDRELGIVYVFA